MKQIIEVANKLKNGIIIELKGTALLTFKTVDPHLLNDDVEARKNAVNEIVTAIQTSIAMDEALMGEDAINLLNIKRSIPHRSFRIILVYDSELIETAIASNWYPNKLLYMNDRIKRVLGIAMQSINKPVLDLTKLDSTIKKVPSKVELEIKKRNDEKAKEAAKKRADLKKRLLAKELDEEKARRAAMFN